MRRVVEYPGRLQIAENLNWHVRLSLTPDGRGITTTLLTARADLWMITGLPK